MRQYEQSKTRELHHHGVIGQKWGVRNGPPYPIENKVLRKGTRLNSISPNNNSSDYKNRKQWMYLYNPNDEWDSKVYKGPFGLYKLESGYKQVYEHRYEVIEDLKMPTSKERFDEFVNLYKNHRLIAAFDLFRERSFLKTFDTENEDDYKVNVWNLKTTEDYKRAYKILNRAMENFRNFKITELYAEIMSTKWDAMVDDNNQAVYNRTHDPIIIFKTDTALKEIGQARILDMEEILKNYDEVNEELSKYEERVSL